MSNKMIILKIILLKKKKWPRVEMQFTKFQTCLRVSNDFFAVFDYFRNTFNTQKETWELILIVFINFNWEIWMIIDDLFIVTIHS